MLPTFAQHTFLINLKLLFNIRLDEINTIKEFIVTRPAFQKFMIFYFII